MEITFIKKSHYSNHITLLVKSKPNLFVQALTLLRIPQLSFFLNRQLRYKY